MDVTPAEIDQRIERAKLEAMKELAYGASHEINNPLANISARAQTLLRDEVDPERRRALQAIHQQAMRAHEMISDLMLFARPPEIELVDVDPRALFEGIAGEFSAMCDQREIKLSTVGETSLPLLRADPLQLHVALSAAVRNSIEAIGQAGSINVRLRHAGDSNHVRFGEPIGCCIEVSDDGPGFSDAALEHGLDPFFSGREAGRGLGFGLSKCWRIMTQHGGDVRIENVAPSGARVSLLLPAQLLGTDADRSNA